MKLYDEHNQHVNFCRDSPAAAVFRPPLLACRLPTSCRTKAPRRRGRGKSTSGREERAELSASLRNFSLQTAAHCCPPRLLIILPRPTSVRRLRTARGGWSTLQRQKTKKQTPLLCFDGHHPREYFDKPALLPCQSPSANRVTRKRNDAKISTATAVGEKRESGRKRKIWKRGRVFDVCCWWGRIEKHHKHVKADNRQCFTYVTLSVPKTSLLLAVTPATRDNAAEAKQRRSSTISAAAARH